MLLILSRSDDSIYNERASIWYLFPFVIALISFSFLLHFFLFSSPCASVEFVCRIEKQFFFCDIYLLDWMMERTEKFQRTIARFIIKKPLFFFISVLLVWSTHLDGTLGYGLCHDDDTNSNCRWWWWWREYKLPYFIYIEIRLALLLLLPWRHAWPTASSAARCCILYLYTRRRRRRFFFFFSKFVWKETYIYIQERSARDVNICE